MRHLRDLLRTRVLDGHYSDGRRGLPGETELMFEFGASRSVVRDALQLLRDERLIQRLQGAGTFVVSNKVTHRFDVLRGLSETVPDSRRRIQGDLIGVAVLPAPPSVAQRLGLSVGDQCLQIDAWAAFDGRPYYLCTSYLSAELEERVRTTDFDGDYYDFLERAGCRLGRSTMSVEAVMADDYVGHWLHVEAGAPLMLFTRTLCDPEDRPVELGYLRCRGDRLVLNLSLSRDADGELTTTPQEGAS